MWEKEVRLERIELRQPLGLKHKTLVKSAFCLQVTDRTPPLCTRFSGILSFFLSNWTIIVSYIRFFIITFLSEIINHQLIN